MIRFSRSLLMTALFAVSATASATQYEDNIHKNDFKWSQFNLMHTIDQKPHDVNGYNDTYLEMEFGGRSGMFELYGYVDIFDVIQSSDSNKSDGANLFVKLSPRLSLDALTGKDLSFGPFKEWYIASVHSIDDTMFENMVGLGTDVELPFLGKTGMNLYARHATESMFNQNEDGEWNGYQFSMNWFKPLHNFSNGSFISYQGYLDYLFGKDTFEDPTQTSSGLGTFHGLFWHTDRFAVGYGLKYFNNIYGIKDSDAFESTGFGHYFSATYKF